MFGEESIYNIIQPTPSVHEKLPIYRSKHRPTIPPTASTFHQAGTTNPMTSNLAGSAEDAVVPNRRSRSMGKPCGLSRNFPEVRKIGQANTRVKSLSEMRRENPAQLKPTQLRPKHRPPVPAKDEQPPLHALVTNKNFIVANAVETILAAPKKPAEGAKDYLKKEDYGKVPKYLKHIKRDIDNEYEYIRTLQEQSRETEGEVQPLDEEERQQLIDGLKAKWEQVNATYQGITHITKLDSMGKVKRKEKSEAELSQIEKDIEKLSRRGILVDPSQ